MRILIAVASRHGGTHEIAARVAHRLGQHGHDVSTVSIPEETATLADHDAYVVGSAVYAGRWMQQARRFLNEHATTFRRRPVWLFSSGPLGERADPAGAVEHPEEMTAAIGARGHAVFPGRLFRDELGPVERFLAAAVHAPDGDFRDWEAIDRWADEIAAELADRPPEAHPAVAS